MKLIQRRIVFLPFPVLVARFEAADEPLNEATEAFGSSSDLVLYGLSGIFVQGSTLAIKLKLFDLGVVFGGEFVALSNFTLSVIPVLGLDVDPGRNVPALPVCNYPNPHGRLTIVPLLTRSEDW